jgi:hypothetical protein
MTDRTVLFVCLHGAGMSRLAAAYFNQAAPRGWRATSAGVETGARLGPTAARLLAGTAAAAFLDEAPPRPIGAVPNPELRVALRNRPSATSCPGPTPGTWRTPTANCCARRSACA